MEPSLSLLVTHLLHSVIFFISLLQYRTDASECVIFAVELLPVCGTSFHSLLIHVLMQPVASATALKSKSKTAMNFRPQRFSFCALQLQV